LHEFYVEIFASSFLYIIPKKSMFMRPNDKALIDTGKHKFSFLFLILKKVETNKK